MSFDWPRLIASNPTANFNIRCELSRKAEGITAAELVLASQGRVTSAAQSTRW